VVTILAFLGLCTSIYLISFLASLISLHCIRKRKIEDLGEWAIVTGATDGIGKAISLQLAKRNMNMMVVGRSDDRVKDLENEIKQVPGFTKEIKSIKFDFSKPQEYKYDAIAQAVGDLDIGILVNNVGVSYKTALMYNELTADEIDELVDVNLRSALHMTRLVFFKMVAKKKGAVICIGSGASVLPSEPLYAGYAAVKAAVESFCRSLQAEAIVNNILVQCQTPLLVTSKLSKIKRPSFTTPTPEVFAKAFIRCVEGASISGCFHTPPTVSPYFVHSMMLQIIHLLPKWLWDKVRYGQTSAIREKYWRKAELAKSQ